MPLQNRVNPEGDICRSDARGTLMGNRGCLHDQQKQIISRSKRDAWVTCLLEFQGRQRTIMEPGSYTELFFLDEATALAAGHRPCATCRRDRYDAFMTAWSKGNRDGQKTLAGEVDKQMKQDRAAGAHCSIDNLSGLPEGVIVKAESDGAFYLVHGGRLRAWSFSGYGPAIPMSSVKGAFIVLTPVSTIKAIEHGYKVALHPSAGA
jgi:hypothetical protein